MENIPNPTENIPNQKNTPKSNKPLWLAVILIIIIAIGAGAFYLYGGKTKPSKPYKSEKIIEKTAQDQKIKTETEDKTGTSAAAEHQLPPFISSIRSYGGMLENPDLQLAKMQEAGFEYQQGNPTFSWESIEPRNDDWKWDAMDEDMDRLARRGMKTIAFLFLPKAGFSWLTREDPKMPEEFGEFVYEVVNRYKNHPAWSGVLAMWGGSADIWNKDFRVTYPEVTIPIMNAGYDGAKRADPSVVVIGFNFATTAHTKQDWEEYQIRAKTLHPKFDWYGVQSHEIYTTTLTTPDSYSGMQGLVNVRRFLDANGYADKPLWVNEGGFTYEAAGSLPQIHAEQVVETFILGPTMPVNLKGWVYFGLFGKSMEDDEGNAGIMDPLSLGLQPRPAWNAVRTLLTTIRFNDYIFERKLAGEPNQPQPYVLQFKHKDDPVSKKLWVVFSPRLAIKNHQPAAQNVTINVAPATILGKTDMFGTQTTINADHEGNITVQSTSAPVYLTVNSWEESPPPK